MQKYYLSYDCLLRYLETKKGSTPKYVKNQVNAILEKIGKHTKR